MCGCAVAPGVSDTAEVTFDPNLPIEHVLRPDLPWRVSAMTECGRDVRDVQAVIDRGRLLVKLRELGVQRAAYTTCMTCAQTSRRWKTWDQDPVDALAREFYGRQDPRLADELRAVAALVAAHRGEFADLMAGLADTVRLADRRAGRRRGVGGVGA